MKILIFYQYFGTPGGSWSTRMYELTRRWVKEGHVVTVVTAPYEKSDIKVTSFISRLTIEGVKLIVINTADSNRDPVWKRAWKALTFALVSCRIAFTESFDVVIASSGPITVGIPALMAKWFRNKVMVFEIRDLWPQGAIELGKIKSGIVKKLALWFEKVCYRNASLIIACSEGMEASVKLRFPEYKTLVISNASDPELFRNSVSNFELPGSIKGKSIFVYAGSLGFMDHGKLMIEAMKKIQDPNVCLVILGEGAERAELEHLSGNGQMKNVYFLGLLPKYQVVEWVRHSIATLVVFKNFPVLQTSSPNKMFDSFAAGIPVIHNTTGWIRQLFLRESCGISIEPEDSDGLANAMIQLVENRMLRNDLAMNAGRLADTTFNRNFLAQKYLTALVDLHKS